MRAPATLLGSGHIEEVEGERRLGGIVQTQQLERVVRRLIPWHRIGHQPREGHLESLSVTATDIGSGKTVVFVQNASGQHARSGARTRSCARSRSPWAPSTRSRRRRCPSCSRPSASASASSATAACARTRRCRRRCAWAPTRCWSSACATSRPPTRASPRNRCRFPGAAFLVGKILDAFLLDHIDYDLDRLRRFNALIEAVRATGSPDHTARFDEVVTADARRALPDRRRVHDPPVGGPGRDRRPHRAHRAASRDRAAAPASSCCAGWRPRAAPTRPTCCRTSCSTASTPPRSRASATRTRAPTTTSWPSSSATRSSTSRDLRPRSAAAREGVRSSCLLDEAELRAAAAPRGGQRRRRDRPRRPPRRRARSAAALWRATGDRHLFGLELAPGPSRLRARRARRRSVGARGDDRDVVAARPPSTGRRGRRRRRPRRPPTREPPSRCAARENDSVARTP